MNLAGRVVLVTGGGRGLGAEICRAVAIAGATTIVADLNEAAANDVAHGIQRSGHRAEGLVLDVGEQAGIVTAIADLTTRHGRLDGIVNNAGVDVTKSLAELEVGEWERVLRTNLHGPFLLAKIALPWLREARGHIVNITSTAAKRTWPNASAYHASKWGLLGLSHALHAELRADGVRVTAIVAGGMRTPFLLDRFPDIDVATLQDPANVARAVLFALTQPEGTVIAEMTVIPTRETSWP